MFPTRCRKGSVATHSHKVTLKPQTWEKSYIYSCTWTIRTWIVFLSCTPFPSRIHGIVLDSAIRKPKNKVDKKETNYRTTCFCLFFFISVSVWHSTTHPTYIYAIPFQVDHSHRFSCTFGKIAYKQLGSRLILQDWLLYQDHFAKLIATATTTIFFLFNFSFWLFRRFTLPDSSAITLY